MPIEVSCSMMSMNSWKTSVTSVFDMLEMRAIATDSRFISNWLMCFMTSAAASSPIDSMTTADFSTSLSRAGLLKSASVTGDPSSDDLSGTCGIVRDERLHGVGFDAEHVLRLAVRPLRPSSRSAVSAGAGGERHRCRGRGDGERRLGAGQPVEQREQAAEQRQQAREGQHGIARDRRHPGFPPPRLSLIHISEPTRQAEISYA